MWVCHPISRMGGPPFRWVSRKVIAHRMFVQYYLLMPKLRHYDKLNTARFVTFSCYRRLRLITTPHVADAIVQTLRLIRETRELMIFGYVLMPEHVYLVVHLPDRLKLGSIIGELKSKSASRIISENLSSLPADCRITKGGKERWAFWQPRCYDHNCRSRETILEKISYCHMNPVKRGLVSEPGHWRCSSYNWYEGTTDVPLVMDRLDTIPYE
jgi:putative transposase